MNLYPAIDLFQGEVVRLKQGDYEQKTVYSNDPAAFAKKWEDQGAEWIHVVDLEGAKTGQMKNMESLHKIRDAVSCNIEFGGGLRTMADVEAVLSLGINRAIIGTKALDEDFLSTLMSRFKSRIGIGLDIRDNLVRMEGWLKAGQPVEDAVKILNKFSVETVIYTDIQKDGALQGPNLEGLKKMMDLLDAKLILSGGVSSLKDIQNARQLQDERIEGIIIGKALYENRFTVAEALETLRETGDIK